MSTRYKSRRPVAVGIQGIIGGYGFMTGISTADSAALGQIELNVAGGLGNSLVFFGSSRPKPPRARKANDGTTSFYDYTGGVPTGWVVTKQAVLPPSPTRRPKSKLVYVKIDTGLYVWNMPTETYEKIGADKAGLGIKDLTSNDKGFIGANSVISSSSGKLGKPKRARKEVTGTDGVDLISAFVEHPLPENLPDGWSV